MSPISIIYRCAEPFMTLPLSAAFPLIADSGDVRRLSEPFCTNLVVIHPSVAFSPLSHLRT
jgi:hypothetical protein